MASKPTKADLKKDIQATKAAARRNGVSAKQQALATGGTVKVSVVARLLGR
jgi:hypothetical protein